MSEGNPEGKPKRTTYYVLLFALIFAAAGALSFIFQVGFTSTEGVAGHVGSVVGAIIFPGLIGMGVGYLIGQRF
ncbi:MAG: hypothetical protein AB7K24_07155 [Gemmataceae bacterium]